MENATPMLRQYLEIKKSYPGTLLFFRLGDFYEMFNEDAILGSRELEITLTARHKDSPNPVPMCGVPHHAAANYISKLVRKGYRVAICEQTEDAGKGVKLVKREVVRVITPGTAIDTQLVESRDSIYLAAICGSGDTFAAAFLELSAGHFSTTQISGAGSWDKICDQVEAFSPREILYPKSLESEILSTFGENDENSLFTDDSPATGGRATLTPQENDNFGLEDCSELLKAQFGVNELRAFGIDGKTDSIRAAGACLTYARETQKTVAGHISAVEYFEPADHMVLDAVTLRNLEIVESRGEGYKRTLFGVLDHTVTGMGSRLLRQWLLRPSLKRSEIQTRLSAVNELSDTIFREKLRFLLKDVSDLERLIGRLNLGTASPRDLLALNRSIKQSPAVNSVLSDATSLLLQVLSENIFEIPEIRDLIDRAMADEPPLNVSDGGVIRAGFDSELDDLRGIAMSAKQTIAAFEADERNRSGISNLKVRFNNVFGYYIEISKGNVSRVPDDYERRQTLANAERYITPQLKEWEQKVLGAEDKILRLESELFQGVRSQVCGETRKLQSTARAFATLDALCSLAEAAARQNYVCPTLHDGDEIEIKSGRHPIVEAFIRTSFIPNDIKLNNSTDRLLIITGANMGGKSTILRQIALIQIMAQIGSFVPATSAKLPIVDRVWTRVGASDDLASGRSTFMVEMTETAEILHNATPRGLILLDEIGRGTSTFDGLSIAWAVAEYLHDSNAHSAKTLFATHYHELTELAENLPGAKNYQITAGEQGGEIVFFHKLQQGKASKSYGIAVAKLAGLPNSVIERANDVLAKLEQYELAVFANEKKTGLAKAAGGQAATQFSLFAIANESAIDELREVEISELSADEAKLLLERIKKKII
ncbi:MAG: DNA mismatch repair protein MutS [Pyrinomonadaceae bacterium]|nr:DNA mismatch repair protein MutS [Acidobacteriota bacterium]MBK7935531.1 DNA mismatch repair protein MutS [Acidobacteriota bacterium]MBP7377689.1 DNA mismatch repair protein MutS [Pyrinomonadaceae bacterium]